MMRYFNWSVETFDAVYNPGNCDFWVLRKHPTRRTYELCPEESSPPMLPWATRQIKVVRKDGKSEDVTLVDFLSIPTPRTSNHAAALRTVIPGHGHQLDAVRMASDETPEARKAFADGVRMRVKPIQLDEVETIDWWAGKISEEGRLLRSDALDGKCTSMRDGDGRPVVMLDGVRARTMSVTAPTESETTTKK